MASYAHLFCALQELVFFYNGNAPYTVKAANLHNSHTHVCVPINEQTAPLPFHFSDNFQLFEHRWA